MHKYKVISTSLPVLLLMYAVLSIYILVQFGYPIEKAQFVCSVSFLFICLVLEVIFPYRKDWLFWKDSQSKNDIFLYLFNTIFLIKASSLLQHFKDKLNLTQISVWPTQLPFLLQLILAFIIFDFFYYWFHRLSHTIKFIWIFHGVHHSSEKIHFLKGNRSNLFLDAFPYLCLTIFPLAFLNPPKNIFISMAYILSIFSFLVHSNINLNFPKWWEFFFISPKIHYMHHDKRVENNIGYNFSTLTLIWDKVFGTFRSYDDVEILNVGIENNKINDSIFWQIVYPYKKKSK